MAQIWKSKMNSAERIIFASSMDLLRQESFSAASKCVVYYRGAVSLVMVLMPVNVQ